MGSPFTLMLVAAVLLLAALRLLALNFVTKSGAYVLDRMLIAGSAEQAHALGVTQSTYIGQFKAHYFQFITVIGMGMQLFLVSRIVKSRAASTTRSPTPRSKASGSAEHDHAEGRARQWPACRCRGRCSLI